MSSQLLLVLAPSWSATTARLQRYARAAGDAWQAVGPEMPATLGRAGLAWGRGLHPAMAGSAKREGDGRAPAGIFALTGLFGYGADDGRFRLPYVTARPGLKCVDDPASRHYNCLVDAADQTPDWSSCEDMLRADARYEIGAVVAHNHAPAHPGAGSCVFLHVWESPTTPTAGCTALGRDDMFEIARWLDGARQPRLVQLPDDAYAHLQGPWDLPRR